MRERIEKARKEQIKSIILTLCVYVCLYFITLLISDDIIFLVVLAFGAICDLIYYCYTRLKEHRFLSELLDDDILSDSRFKRRVFNSEELLKRKIARVFEENSSEYFSFSNNFIDKSDGYIAKWNDRKLVLYPIRFFREFFIWSFLTIFYLYLLINAPLLYCCVLFVFVYFIFIGPCRRKFFTKEESFSDGKTQIPIKDIIALQILSSREAYSDYQLNLVLKDLTRRSVSCSKALYRVVSLAQTISNFLCIPIVTTESQLLAIYQSKALGLVNTIARKNDKE